MNIWKKFKKKGEAMPNLRRRGCWLKCFGCDENWEKLPTIWVHMVVLTKEGKQDSRFICDECLKDDFNKI